jgi:hypothetical protein
MRTILLCLCLLLPPGARACTVEALAQVPLATGANVLTVPVEVNATLATFILDTGAERSVVSGEAVRRLGLARDPWVGTTMGGIGGIDRRPNANPRSLTLGGIKLQRQTLTRDTSLTVAALPLDRVGDRQIDGLLGRDYLASFDLDLDLPNARLTLYAVRDCAGRFLPWSGSYAGTPFDSPASRAVILPVLLDGTLLRGLLDTGASTSLLAAPGIYRMGLDAARLAADPQATISGVGPRSVTARRHTFRALAAAGRTLARPELLVQPVRLSPITDMLLGADWLAGQRTWVSFATRQVFVARP